AACIHDSGGDGKIILFYAGDAVERDVLGELRKTLPRYMLPSKAVRLEQLPYAANMKVDRIRLRAMEV
ncbi:MAG: AMP-dependent synthetase, partial [Defluviitaleaceae bacterium]|nr:AMP-dependent synthetase [Defluviitaleaceae bacterium]